MHFERGANCKQAISIFSKPQKTTSAGLHIRP
jgi:hypothetical protein